MLIVASAAAQAIGVLGAIGGLGAIATVYLLPKQRRSIEISASKAAVETMNIAMTALRDELEMTKRALWEAQQRMDQVREADAIERKRLAAEIDRLRKRIAELEARLREGRRAVDRGDVPDAYRGVERRVRPDSVTLPEDHDQQ